jgi:hypothetical protein
MHVTKLPVTEVTEFMIHTLIAINLERIPQFVSKVNSSSYSEMKVLGLSSRHVHGVGINELDWTSSSAAQSNSSTIIRLF